jgi:RecB family exonuclease
MTATDHEAQAHEFLAKGREYLDAGDLHQASEKGWGAAAHMAKAVAVAQGWEYQRHSQFHHVMTEARRLTGSDRLRFLHGRADILHVNFYELKGSLDAEEIRLDLESIEDLLSILAPLTAG